MANKIIRAKKRPDQRRHDPIDVEFLRNGEPFVVTFQPAGTADAAALNMALQGAKHPDRALEGMTRFIGKMLANDDGVPAAWEPRPYEPPAEEPQDLDELDRAQAEALREQAREILADERDDDSNTERMFVGPDGEPYPYELLDKFTAFEAGSSRRRWRQLLDNDDDLVIEAEVLSALFEHLAALAANRPTRRPS